jgi:hypothetical protein
VHGQGGAFKASLLSNMILSALSALAELMSFTYYSCLLVRLQRLRWAQPYLRSITSLTISRSFPWS